MCNISAIAKHFILLGISVSGIWLAVLLISLIFNIIQIQNYFEEMGRIYARSAWQRDLVYHSWSQRPKEEPLPAQESQPSNPPPAKALKAAPKKSAALSQTFIKQNIKLSDKNIGIQGHLVSVNPANPLDAPDDWEANALAKFAAGGQEFSATVIKDGEEYIRLMRPLTADQNCLKCHSADKFTIGLLRGGISEMVPMKELNNIASDRILHLSLIHSIFFLLGITGVIISMKYRHGNALIRKKAEDEREKLIMELQEALANIKTLRGLIPICANCKKIRDDKGFWNQVEVYVSEHSEADFTHSICPECVKKLYGDLLREKDDFKVKYD